MTSDPALREALEQAVRDLFTNGRGERADRLVLMKASRDIGGWCESAVVNRLLARLRDGGSAPQDQEGELAPLMPGKNPRTAEMRGERLRGAAALPSPTEPHVEALRTRAADWLSRLFDYEVKPGCHTTAFEREAQQIIAALLICVDPEVSGAALPSDGPPKTQQEIIDRFAWAAERMSREQIAAALAGVSNLKGAAPPVAYAPVEHRTAWR